MNTNTKQDVVFDHWQLIRQRDAYKAHAERLAEKGKALRDWCDANLNGSPLDYSKIITSLDEALAQWEEAQK